MKRSYAPVRALERGLDILLTLSRIGRARPTELASATGLDRTTTYRLLETLEAKGMVARSEADDSYFLSIGVRRLSDGYTINDRVLRLVALELGALLAKVQWPSDYATFSGGQMIIDETTHPFSPFSVHRRMVGRARPVMRSALGRAMLAGASERRREILLEITATSPVDDAGEAAHRPAVDHLLSEFAERGYAWSVGRTDPQIAAIALPLVVGGEALGAINILFFRSAMTVEQCADRFLGTLRYSVTSLQKKIEAEGVVIS